MKAKRPGHDINAAFTRAVLSSVLPIVKKVTTPAERKEAWVYNHGRSHWEFHGPEEFYWHGTADNAADARSKGWYAWLDQLEKDPAALVARLYEM